MPRITGDEESLPTTQCETTSGKRVGCGRPTFWKDNSSHAVSKPWMREPESSLSVQRNVLNERGTLKSEGTQEQESIPLLCSTGKVFVLRPQWVCEFPVFPTQKNNEPVVHYVSIK